MPATKPKAYPQRRKAKPKAPIKAGGPGKSNRHMFRFTQKIQRKKNPKFKTIGEYQRWYNSKKGPGGARDTNYLI